MLAHPNIWYVVRDETVVAGQKITLGASSEVDHYLWEISLIIDVFF